MFYACKCESENPTGYTIHVNTQTRRIVDFVALTPSGPVSVAYDTQDSLRYMYNIYLNPADTVSVFVIHQSNPDVSDTLVYSYQTSVRYESTLCGFLYRFHNVRLQSTTFDNAFVQGPFYFSLP